MSQRLLITFWIFAVVAPVPVPACIWDSDTLADEKKKSPDMAALILGTKRPTPDTNAFLKRINALKSNPRESDPAWWNDLAGAHLRLGNAQEAATLLEPLLSRFPNDYGVHANLGTAYHLLGRYADAEREIARDLELNTNAHFGLELYHLALLQYLSRDQDYQSRHAYVDEFTPVLLSHDRITQPKAPDGLASSNSSGSPREIAYIEAALADQSVTNARVRAELLLQLASLDPLPAYRFKWNLAHNANFEKGVRYMAELNSSQPACFVMLGLACIKAEDLNLATHAFERAIKLGSPQRQILEDRIAEMKEHTDHARFNRGGWVLPVGTVLFVGLVILYFLFRIVRRLFLSTSTRTRV